MPVTNVSPASKFSSLDSKATFGKEFVPWKRESPVLPVPEISNLPNVLDTSNASTSAPAAEPASPEFHGTFDDDRAAGEGDNPVQEEVIPDVPDTSNASNNAPTTSAPTATIPGIGLGITINDAQIELNGSVVFPPGARTQDAATYTDTTWNASHLGMPSDLDSNIRAMVEDFLQRILIIPYLNHAWENTVLNNKCLGMVRIEKQEDGFEDKMDWEYTVRMIPPVLGQSSSRHPEVE